MRSVYQAAHASRAPRHAKARAPSVVLASTLLAAILAILALGYGGYAAGNYVTGHHPVSVSRCSCRAVPASPSYPKSQPAAAPGQIHSGAARHELHLRHLHHMHELHLAHLRMLLSGVSRE